MLSAVHPSETAFFHEGAMDSWSGRPELIQGFLIPHIEQNGGLDEPHLHRDS